MQCMLSRDACLHILRLFYFAKYPWFISACFVVRCILAGSCKDSGKTYALYTINVFRASSEGTKSWTIFRRYSDFDDLHMHLKEKVAINLFIFFSPLFLCRLPVLVKVPNRQNTFPLVFGWKSVLTVGKYLSQTFSQPLFFPSSGMREGSWELDHSHTWSRVRWRRYLFF